MTDVDFMIYNIYYIIYLYALYMLAINFEILNKTVSTKYPSFKIIFYQF